MKFGKRFAWVLETSDKLFMMISPLLGILQLLYNFYSFFLPWSESGSWDCRSFWENNRKRKQYQSCFVRLIRVELEHENNCDEFQTIVEAKGVWKCRILSTFVMNYGRTAEQIMLVLGLRLQLWPGATSYYKGVWFPRNYGTSSPLCLYLKEHCVQIGRPPVYVDV